ncbi:MAG: hypothetical protein ACLGXA_25295 [Acidobacteriota bacterium]
MKPETKSSLYPRTVFHADGVKTVIAQDEEQHAKLNAQGWFNAPQPPPPPAEPPMTPEEKAAMFESELEGLGDQVDAQAGVLTALEDRVSKLEEALANAATAFESIEQRLAALEKKRGKE